MVRIYVSLNIFSWKRHTSSNFLCGYTTAKNGHVERKHRHILNVARSLLFQASLSIKFWGEAILTASHLINRIPSSVLKGRTPYELLYGVLPSYSHLKFFGCLCYVHLKLRDKNKFSLRNAKCIFVGYPFGQKGWKVYDLEKKVFLISKDVIFHETEFPLASISIVNPPVSPTILQVPYASDEDWEILETPTSGDRGAWIWQLRHQLLLCQNQSLSFQKHSHLALLYQLHSHLHQLYSNLLQLNYLHQYLSCFHPLIRWLEDNDRMFNQLKFETTFCIMLAALKKPLSLTHLLHQRCLKTIQVRHSILWMIMLLSTSQCRIRHS